MTRRHSRPNVVAAFTRSQLAAFSATWVDFGTLIILVEVLGVWYVAATAAGSFVGATTNFLLGRYWSFKASHGKMHYQALRYALTGSTSLILNTTGVYLLTDRLGIQYIVSKAVSGLVVGLLFNFPLQRGYVFQWEDSKDGDQDQLIK